MELEVLGASGAWPLPDRPCSGYLISDRDTTILIDAGGGTMAQLLRRHSLSELSALWLTHVHADHASDLGLIRNALAYGSARGGRPLDVFGPPGWRHWFDAAVPDQEATQRAFCCREVSDRGAYDVGGLRITAFAMRHSVPTCGCRVQAEGAIFAFSADSGPCPALVELARDVDLFLCEAYLSGPAAETSEIVMTPEEAGSAAAAAGARSLLLTHLHPQAEAGAAAERARSTFSGPVAVASPGATYPIGRYSGR
jgi:ribonuclease BN (tRNA processing enzyme)